MILSAQFANAERTAVVVITDDRGAVSISADRPELWAQYLAWPGATAAFVPDNVSDMDLAELNRVLAQDGSVLRALAELTLIEINKLRADHARAPYTKAQFVAALKAQMRT